MKLNLIIPLFAFTFALHLVSRAAVPLRWTVETSRATPAQFEAYQGETLDLEATLQSSGKPLELSGIAALYWQTNGMGSTYWEASAAVNSNRLSAVWTPEMDVGAKSYNCFIGQPGTIYHAAFQLRLRPSPGATPNVLPLPVKTLDFSKVVVLNPPYYTKDETDTRISNATNALRRVDGAARTLPKYLWRYDSFDSYEKDAYWYYAQEDATSSISPGLCSARRVGGILERNYDWYRDNAAEFAVLTEPGPGRFASAGIANIGESLTEEFVTSGAPSRFYKCLPGRTVDGVNSEGVAIEVNVVVTNGSPWETHVDGDGRDIDSRWAVRWTLDNAPTAGWAASNLASRVYLAKAMRARGYSVHYAIVDRESTWLVEDGKALVRPANWPLVMTNFRLDTTPSRILSNDPYGAGYERYFMLTNSAVSLTNAWYSNAYRRNASGDFPWPTEFAGSIDAEGPIPNDATSRLQAWAKANIPAAVPDAAFPRGAGLWQTVHSSSYDLTNLTLRVAVQEQDDWYVFQVPQDGKVKSVNGRTGDVVLGAADVGALPDTFEEQDPTAAAKAQAVFEANVVDGLESSETNKALSANMGRELKESIDSIKSRGRYLSIWNCSTGLATTRATSTPYDYRAGDFFIVGVVGATNYRPSGSQYTNDVPSGAVEPETVKVNDTYYFDGTSWGLIKTPNPEIPTKVSAFENDVGYATNSDVSAALETKADKSTTYTKTEVDASLAAKRDKTDRAAYELKWDLSPIYDAAPTFPDPVFMAASEEDYGWILVLTTDPVDILPYAADTSVFYQTKAEALAAVVFHVTTAPQFRSIVGKVIYKRATPTGDTLALSSDVPAPVEVIDPASATTTGKAADALSVKQALAGKQDALNSAQTNAVNSGITAAKVSTYDGYATSKADKSTTYTKSEVDTELGKKVTAYIETVTYETTIQETSGPGGTYGPILMQYNSEHNYFYVFIAGGGGEVRVSEKVPGVSFNYDSFDRGSPLYHFELTRVGTSNVYALYSGDDQSVRFVYGGSQSITHTDTAPKAVELYNPVEALNGALDAANTNEAVRAATGTNIMSIVSGHPALDGEIETIARPLFETAKGAADAAQDSADAAQDSADAAQSAAESAQDAADAAQATADAALPSSHPYGDVLGSWGYDDYSGNYGLKIYGSGDSGVWLTPYDVVWDSGGPYSTRLSLLGLSDEISYLYGDYYSLSDGLWSHVYNYYGSNPHGVTASDVGAPTYEEVDSMISEITPESIGAATQMDIESEISATKTHFRDQVLAVGMNIDPTAAAEINRILERGSFESNCIVVVKHVLMNNAEVARMIVDSAKLYHDPGLGVTWQVEVTNGCFYSHIVSEDNLANNIH